MMPALNASWRYFRTAFALTSSTHMRSHSSKNFSKSAASWENHLQKQEPQCQCCSITISLWAVWLSSLSLSLLSLSRKAALAGRHVVMWALPSNGLLIAQPDLIAVRTMYNQGVPTPLSTEVATNKHQRALTVLFDTSSRPRNCSRCHSFPSHPSLRGRAWGQSFPRSHTFGRKLYMELAVFISISQAPIQRLGTLFLHASVCRGGGERGHHGIMPPAIACSLKRKREACCCLNVPKTPGPADVGLLTCSSPLTVDPLLRSAWPSWHLRGRKSWERRRAHKFGGCLGLWNQERSPRHNEGNHLPPIGCWKRRSLGAPLCRIASKDLSCSRCSRGGRRGSVPKCCKRWDCLHLPRVCGPPSPHGADRASSSWASPWHPSSLSDYLGGRLSRERQHRLQKHNFPIQSCGLPGVDCCLLHRHELPLTPFHGFCCLQQVNLPVQQVMFLPFVSILAGACGLTRAFYFCLFFLPWSLVTLVLLRRRDFALCRVSAIRAEENSQALAFSDLSFWEQVTLWQTVVCIIYTTWPHISYFLICSLLFLARLHQAPLNKEPFDFNLNHHVFRIRQWSSFLWMFLTQAAVSTMLPSLPRGMAAEVEIKNDPRNLRWGKESKRRKKDPGYRIWL